MAILRCSRWAVARAKRTRITPAGRCLKRRSNGNPNNILWPPGTHSQIYDLRAKPQPDSRVMSNARRGDRAPAKAAATSATRLFAAVSVDNSLAPLAAADQLL